MREIEFRAVLKGVERKIYEVLSIDYTTDTIILWDGVEDDLISETIKCNFKDVILLQYTGLKDKNGVKIYEGDIVFNEYYDEYGKVVYGEGAYVVKYSTWEHDLVEAYQYSEVISNINPELIGAGNGNQ